MILRNFIVSLAVTLWALQAHAEQRGLLIGVTDYAPEVTARAGVLTGPGRDVALMTDVLLSGGIAPEAMTILSDLPQLLPDAVRTQRPTRDAILDALDQLAAEAAAGDRIVIYLAGHGAQIPALGADEPDGRDEVFLPSDFELASDGSPRNAVLDDEIGTRIDRMIMAGADVWLIADTCHSGSLRRDADPVAQARFVNLMPEDATATQQVFPVDLSPDRTTQVGQFIGFYGAEAGALAYETRPPGVDTSHGLLTWTLVQALRSGRADTYRALANEVSAKLWRIGRGRARPVFAGALHAPLMIGAGKNPSSSYGVEIDTQFALQAGRLDGVLPGSAIEVADHDGRALFTVSLNEVTLTRSFAPLPKGQMPALDARLKEEGLDPDRFRFRWLRDRAPELSGRIVSTPLDVGMPVGLSLSALSPDLRLETERMIAASAPALRRDDDSAEVHIVSENGMLALRPSPPGATQDLRVPATPQSLPRLAMLLRRAAKARGLLAVADALGDSALSKALRIEIHGRAGRPTGKGCVQDSAARKIDLGDAQPPPVFHCDRVHVTLYNDSDLPIDVTPLYLAPDYQVFFLSGYDEAERGGWRIPAQGHRELSYTEATRQPDGSAIATGPMHLIFFAEYGAHGETPVDYRFLQSADPPPQTRAGVRTGLRAALTEAGFGLVKTRAMGNTEIAQSGALIIPLRTVPEEEVTRREN